MGADNAHHHIGALTCLKPWQGLIILMLVFLSFSALKNALFLGLCVPALPHNEANVSMTDGLPCSPQSQQTKGLLN